MRMAGCQIRTKGLKFIKRSENSEVQIFVVYSTLPSRIPNCIIISILSVQARELQIAIETERKSRGTNNKNWPA